jgi:CRP-like cAMP-binding protein
VTVLRSHCAHGFETLWTVTADATTPGGLSLIEGLMPKDNHGVRRAVAKRISDGAGVSRSESNLILQSISVSEYQTLLPHLEPVSMGLHQVLHQAGEPITCGYFPNGGVVSYIVPVSDGRSAEVGMVGREGFVGAPLAGGLDRSPQVALVQVPATAMRIGADALKEVLLAVPHLGVLLTRYALIQGMQLAQTAACNRLHNLEQRLARWLLMSQDRVNSNALPYTQGLLAVMLGTDRPSVSVAVGELQAKGSVKQRRGRIEILDRSRLQASACECYRIIREYNSELGPDLV